jgi:hypothetical protein
VGIGFFWLYKELQEPSFLSLFWDSASSPGSPGWKGWRSEDWMEKMVPFCATWKGIFTHLRYSSFPPDPPAGVGPSVQHEPAPPLESACDVSVPVCATWADTSSRPSHPFSSCPLIHPEGGSSDGESTPLASRTAHANRAVPYDRSSRPTLRPRCNPYPPQPIVSLLPRLPYNI